MGLSKYVKKKILITVKTYPLPSPRCREVVCTAGIEETGGFIRLYPIGFRYLDYAKQYRKYEWIEVECKKSTTDLRKESFEPNTDTIKTLDNIPTTKGNWNGRAKYVLPLLSKSMEELYGKQKKDKTSLGIIKPKEITDFIIEDDEADWPEKWEAVFRQLNLIGPNRKPLDKIPFKFSYKFRCDDDRCQGHKMMITDWEVGACYLNALKTSASSEEATQKVRKRFFEEICSKERDTYFYVGTLLIHQNTWIIIGLFYPKKRSSTSQKEQLGIW